MNKLIVCLCLISVEFSAFGLDCTSTAEQAALAVHREQLTDGTTLGIPKLVGKTLQIEAESTLGLNAQLFSVSIRDEAATEKWLVVLDRSTKCRLRGVVHVDAR